MKIYEKVSQAYEEHLMWCLDNNGAYTQEEWDAMKAANFHKVFKKYGLSISYCNYEDMSVE